MTVAELIRKLLKCGDLGKEVCIIDDDGVPRSVDDVNTLSTHKETYLIMGDEK